MDKVAVQIDGHTLTLSNLTKVLYPADGFTKAEVLDYYQRISAVLLPHIAGRPMTLKRYPEGVDAESFFAKHAPAHRPDWIRTEDVESRSSRSREPGATVSYLVIDDLAALIWAANLAGLELHVPMWRFPGREPDLLVFDLDPGLPATVVDCCRVAEELRPLLEDEGLRPLPKTSGGKGLQLYAAISGLTAEQASARAKALAERMEERAPRPGGVPDDQVAARGQGAHRLEPEQRLQDHHRPLLAARQDPPHRVDPGHVGRSGRPAGRPTTFSSPRPTSSPAWTPTATFSPPCSPYCRPRHYRRVVANITMYDTIYNNQFPAGAQAYAAYVDGGLGNQPNYAYIVNTFPKAEHLSIALSSSNNADALDVEAGAATPGEIPAWCTRQRQRGIQRPCIYANASTMQGSVLPVLSRGEDRPVHRAAVDRALRARRAHLRSQQLQSAEHRGRRHAVDVQRARPGPRPVRAAIQLLHHFSTTAATAEAELESGELNTGKNALTSIAVAPGTAHHIGFGCDNGVAASQPAVLRVAIYDTGWHITQNVVVDGSKGLHVMTFPNPAKTGVVSVVRMDAAGFPVGYVVY